MKIVIENVAVEDPTVLSVIGDALKKLGSRASSEAPEEIPEPEPLATVPPHIMEEVKTATETHDKSYAETITVPEPEAEPVAEPVTEPEAEPDFNGADAYAPTAPELDLDGLPWDARIHASSKATIKNGAWKRKRGISEDLYNSVVAELRADFPEQTPAEPVKELDGTVKPDPNDVFNGNVGAVGTPPPAIPQELEYTAVSLLAELANAVQNGVCTQAEVDTVIPIVLNENGLTSISEIMGRPELVLPIRERLNDLLGPRA